MTVRFHNRKLSKLDGAGLRAWDGAEAAPVSDCLERGNSMDGGIGPLDRSMRILGQARTVRCMVGDNSALHAAINLLGPGEILVVDAGGYLDRAVWGGLMTRAAIKKKIGGLVIDGAVRDSAEICALGFPCFARACVPCGPHKNFGGEIDADIACGGVSVSPGDLIIGDGDGVTVVPLERIDETLEAFKALKAKEAKALSALEAGETLSDLYGVPEIKPV